MNIEVFKEEHKRIAANFEMAYDNYLQKYNNPALLYNYHIKEVTGKKYLYSYNRERKKEKSLGFFNEALALKYENIKEEKRYAEESLEKAQDHLESLIEQFKILKIPKINKTVGKILRQLDKNELLGNYFLVVGTFAFYTYGIAAGIRENNYYKPTLDLDFTWYKKRVSEGNTEEKDNSNYKSFLYQLRKVDKSFNMHYKKSYQSINGAGFEVELLCAPSSMSNLKSKEQQFKPIDGMIEQEWLLNGKIIRHVLLDEDNLPVPICSPDPRWMALHKLWLSQKSTRNPLKISKDKEQGLSLLKIVSEKLTVNYPLNEEFLNSLPVELKGIMTQWMKENNVTPTKKTTLKLF